MLFVPYHLSLCPFICNNFFFQKKDAAHGITIMRELFHHLPELPPKLHNRVWYFICTSPLKKIESNVQIKMIPQRQKAFI